MINKNTMLPLHSQISDTLRNQILQGNWKNNALFPTDKEWANIFRVSITTVRQAVATLVKEGFLTRQAGKGTFVHLPQFSDTINALSGCFDDVRQRGGVPSAKLIFTGIVALSPLRIVNVPFLKAFEARHAYMVEKIQLMDQKPLAHVISYWPAFYAEEFAQYDLEHCGLYDIINSLGLQRQRAEQTIKAELPTEELSKLLEIPMSLPLLSTQRIVYLSSQTIEVSYNRYRSDKYIYRVQLK